MQTEAQKYQAKNGITSKTVETVLPGSGGRGWKVEWYEHGVLLPRGMTGWAMDKMAERLGAGG